MKITVKKTRTTEEEIEVQLPVFLKEKNEEYPVYIKVFSEDRYLRIRIGHEDRINIATYHLSSGEYFTDLYEQITEDEFEEKLKEIIQLAQSLSQHYHFDPPTNIIEHAKLEP